MENPRNILKRIKWKSVFLAIVILLIVFFIAIGFNPFGLDYKGEGDIKIKSWLEPNKVDLEDSSTIWVEVKNTGKGKETVSVSLETYDPHLRFLDGTQEKTTAVTLGPGESRELDSEIDIQAIRGGSYGISITATYDNEKIEDQVYLTVRSP